MVSADASNLAELRRGTDPSRAASPMLSKASRLSQVPGTWCENRIANAIKN